MAENAAYQCMENGGGKRANIDTFVAHCACRVQCWDKVKDLDGTLENMLNVFSVLLFTRTLSNATMGAMNALLPYNCTKRSPPQFSGSYMSYVSLVDVWKTWERTVTLNGRVHKFDGPRAYHFWSTSLKAPFFYTCNTVVLYTRLN